MGLATRLASGLWSTANAAARSLNQRGILPAARLDTRVLSVGNLQAGGAGKTPLTALIAAEACERGLRTCILTRGYGGRWEREGGVILPGSAPVDADLAGDEPALLQWKVPQATIAIGADRVRQFEEATKLAGSRFDLAILDDGFQHWKIRKDLEIVLITSSGAGERVYRDSWSALAAADLVVWTKGDRPPETGGRPCVRAELVPKQVLGAEARSLLLVSGVGDGHELRRSFEKAGLRLLRHAELRDHARYDRPTARALLAEAEREGARVALTGKDWVKWRKLGVSTEEVAVFEPEIRMREGRELWLKLLWAE